MIKESMRVRIDTSEVIHGREYKGSINFGNHRFHYELKFDVLPEELDKLADSNYEEARRRVHLYVTDTNANPITLDDRLQTSFVLITCELAFGLYKSPQRMEISGKSSAVYPILHPKEYPGLAGISFNFEMERDFQMPTSPELKSLLETYKM